MRAFSPFIVLGITLGSLCGLRRVSMLLSTIGGKLEDAKDEEIAAPRAEIERLGGAPAPVAPDPGYSASPPLAAGAGGAAEAKAATKESCGIVFVHLRKTGGTYIGNILRWWLKKSTDCCGSSKPEEARCPRANRFMLSKNYNDWSCPSFHFAEQEYTAYNPQVLDLPCVFSVTSIRDPVQRVISHFLFQFVANQVRDFKKRHRHTSSKDVCLSFLKNKTLWAAYLDRGTACPRRPKPFKVRYAIPNYYSNALDPWYGDVEAVDYENDPSATKESRLIGQNSHEMWKALGKRGAFHRSRRSRSLEEGADRALRMLSKFSLVLTDARKETWWDSLSGGLLGMGRISNATVASLERGRSDIPGGRSNAKMCGDQGSGGPYEGVPEEILERIRRENRIDIAIYNAWLQKTEMA